MSPNPALLTWPRTVTGGGAVGEFLGEYTGSTGDSIAGAALGSPAASRLIVAAIPWRNLATNNRSITGVTIGGVTATQAVSSPSARGGGSIWYATVPTGATADVTIGIGSNSVWRLGLYRIGSGASVVDIGSDVYDTVDTTLTTTIDTANGGLVVAAAGAQIDVDLIAGVNEDSADAQCVFGHSIGDGSSLVVTAATSHSYHNGLAAVSFTAA